MRHHRDYTLCYYDELPREGAEMDDLRIGPLDVTPIGYQGPAQHTYTAGCDGFHEPGQCKAAPIEIVVTHFPDSYQDAVPPRIWDAT